MKMLEQVNIKGMYAMNFGYVRDKQSQLKIATQQLNATTWKTYSKFEY